MHLTCRVGPPVESLRFRPVPTQPSCRQGEKWKTNPRGYHRVTSYTESVSHRDNAVREAAELRLPRIWSVTIAQRFPGCLTHLQVPRIGFLVLKIHDLVWE